MGVRDQRASADGRHTASPQPRRTNDARRHDAQFPATPTARLESITGVRGAVLYSTRNAARILGSGRGARGGPGERERRGRRTHPVM